MSEFRGVVYLVGAGPGDPGLLTLRGAELLSSCDALVYDRLGTEALMELVPEGAEKVYVGKQPGKKAASQEEIHEHLLRLARSHERVVRLKGGDPFVFGRGGEEVLIMKEHGVPFEVVPGVTSGIAAPAYAGIPVTHRAVSVGLSIFTAHEDPTKGDSQLNLDSLAQPGTTGVFYMGRRNLPKICAKLQELGRSADTPVALVEWGTYPRQRTVTGTLGTIEGIADEAGIVPPCITVVGEVVKFREEMAWFDRRPLFGRTVAVTRARAQASDLVGLLEALGARVLEVPTIRLEPPEEPEKVLEAARKVGDYDWVLFTSVNAVHRFFHALRETGGDSRRLAGVKVVAIGKSTSRALGEQGVVPDVVPPVFRAEGVLEALEGLAEGQRILLPRAAAAREVLPDTLRERGAEVDVVPVYRTVCAEVPEHAKEAFEKEAVDVVTFTSSSTVENFHEAIGQHVPRSFRVASIGPVTSKTAEELGYAIDWTAAEASVPALAEAVAAGLSG